MKNNTITWCAGGYSDRKCDPKVSVMGWMAYCTKIDKERRATGILYISPSSGIIVFVLQDWALAHCRVLWQSSCSEHICRVQVAQKYWGTSGIQETRQVQQSSTIMWVTEWTNICCGSNCQWIKKWTLFATDWLKLWYQEPPDQAREETKTTSLQQRHKRVREHQENHKRPKKNCAIQSGERVSSRPPCIQWRLDRQTLWWS